MEIIGLLATVVIFVLLFTAVFKKLNMKATLCFLCIVALLVAAALGTDKIPEKSGLIWFDVFEYLPTYFGTQLGGTALIILFVVAFSMYMAEIGASQRLGEALAKPILKIKSKVLLLACSTVIAFVLMLILPSAMGTFVVCLGVLFPTLVAAGINPISIMLAFFVGCNVVMGPGNPFAVLVLGMMDGAPDAATFFIQYALPVGAITMVCAGIVGALWNLHLDKKVSEFPVVSEEALPQSAECAAPKWYALFPVLPIVLLIVFSKLTGLGIVFSVAGGYFFSLIVVFIVHFLVSKNKLESYNGFAHFFDYFGNVMKSPVIIVCLSMFFGQAISLVGGLDFLVNGIIDTFGFGWYALLVVVAVLYFVMCIFVGNSIAIPVCVPIVVAAMIALGMESQLAMAALILTFVGGLGKSLTPYEPKFMYISELCGNYNTMDLVKRNSVPIVFAFVLSLVLSIVMYGVMA